MYIRTAIIVVGVAVVASCAPRASETARDAKVSRYEGTPTAVVDTTIQATFDAAGVAEPFQQATLSTKLMGTVVAVMVREGDTVAMGEPLARIDSRDIAAKEAQAGAAIADAEANRRDASVQAARIRSLYADSAATRSQLDAIETALARAEAAEKTAQAAASEVGAVRDYSVIRAPFAGVVTRRYVDVGAFAAPGTPLLSVQDISRLRVTANVAPRAIQSLRRGASIAVTVEGRAMTGVVEGIVPAAAGNLYTVNAIIANRDRSILAGSTATLSLAQGTRRALVVPATALRREGDLTGVIVRSGTSDQLRWVRVGHVGGGLAEVTSGLQAGDVVVVPNATTGAAPATTVGRN